MNKSSSCPASLAIFLMPMSFNLVILIDSWWSLMILICISLMTSNQRREWHPTPVLLPGKSHGQRSLVGCSPWGHLESDTTEQLHFHLSLSCIGEGNGNPRQYSCLENPRDGRAWRAAVYGVAQSQTWLKQLSSRILVYFLEIASKIVDGLANLLNQLGFALKHSRRVTLIL